jgi:hypothetical protein
MRYVMRINICHDDFPEVQAAIYRVALSLDSLLLDGISFGVICRDVFDGFLQKPAGVLLEALASLEQYAPHAPATLHPKVTEVLGTLRARCRQLIDLVNGLRAFRALPLQELRSMVSQIPPLREECVQLIQELEDCFGTPKPFYQSRPSHSTATVNDFLNNLEGVIAEEWVASNAEKAGT